MRNMKWITVVLALMMSILLLAGCAPTIVVLQEAPKEEKPAVSDTEKQEAAEGQVKTGISLVSTYTATAAGDADGLENGVVLRQDKKRYLHPVP